MENENEIPKYRKDEEISELLAEMKRLGTRQFREMFGIEEFERLKKIVKEEERLGPIRQKIRLQGKLKHDWPICEKCTFWKDLHSKDWTACPYEHLEKNITFEINELAGNEMAVEVCEMFNWKKES